MFIDKISSNRNYIVANVTSVDTKNKLTRNPYAKLQTSKNKKKSNSDSFKDSLDSISSLPNSNQDSNDFSKVLMDELNEIANLKHRGTFREIKASIKNASVNITATSANNNNANNLEVKELCGAESENNAVDASALCKKIQILNSLKR